MSLVWKELYKLLFTMITHDDDIITIALLTLFLFLFILLFFEPIKTSHSDGALIAATGSADLLGPDLVEWMNRYSLVLCRGPRGVR